MFECEYHFCARCGMRLNPYYGEVGDKCIKNKDIVYIIEKNNINSNFFNYVALMGVLMAVSLTLVFGAASLQEELDSESIKMIVFGAEILVYMAIAAFVFGILHTIYRLVKLKNKKWYYDMP